MLVMIQADGKQYQSIEINYKIMGEIKVLNYLNDQKRTNAECTAELIEIESLFNEQSWKELTMKILALISHPAFRNKDCLTFEFYSNFVSTFEKRLDPYALVEIVGVLTNFISDKRKAIEILESVEDTVKGCNEAVWHCYILKGQIQLDHFNDVVATKRIINALSSALGKASDLPVHWNRFLLATNFLHRVVDECNENYLRLEEKFVKLENEFEKQGKTFEERLLSVQTEIDAKFTTEAVRNFEEVIHSQTEVSNLRKLNGRLLNECSQLRNQRNTLEDDKIQLESKLETIITEQEQQKNALMLMGALLEKLSVKNDDDDTSNLGNKTA
ncbi:26S proteasome non-ATPase regulatory subunit 13 homolog A-like [Bradysia coprophila]|uniref:26S proteasome non-ATPase regulatory subunit 13 homolog A-like n=1 Tax=Bradysia coprophila TaxID=38358 RepID=UPI00187DA0A3|nr:26S proteasome non-ATPase regulatory subunit 13 homolog A-like [Bradysia coprophila]